MAINRPLVVLGGVLLAALAIWRIRAASAAVNAPAPPPSPEPNPSAKEPMSPTYAPSAPFQTKPENAILDASGWVPFHGVLVTALPLRDSANGRFARLSYRDAVQVADQMGAMLLTTSLVDAINDEGLELSPYPTELVKTAYDASHLQNESYDTAEDAAIAKQLTDLGWDGKTPVGNGWKDWIRDAPAGIAWNYGWRDPKTKKYVQTLGDKHADTYFDYSQLTRLVKGA